LLQGLSINMVLWSNFATVSACASSSHAIGCALIFFETDAKAYYNRWIWSTPYPWLYGGFHAMKALSEIMRVQNSFKAFRQYTWWLCLEKWCLFNTQESEHALARGAKLC
jgi:hypothetical protein